jgi:ATP-dependent HslUV protease ATP-binding subunit HslU
MEIEKSIEHIENARDLTPSQIVIELDKYVIGQDAAKKSVAIALRNRWRRMKVEGALKNEIIPNNIIMIGPTGVGKTEIARRLAKLTGAPFVKVEATKFTEVGYVGRDVDSMVRDLMERGVKMVKEEQTKLKKAEAAKNVEEELINILLPPIKKGGPSFDTETEEDAKDLEETREKFRAMLRNGILEDREVFIDVQSDNNSTMQILGPIGLDDMGMNLQDLIGNIAPRKKKRKKVKISDARVILEKEEIERLLDMDLIIKEALDVVQNNGIIFIDEVDKIASGGSQGGGSKADVSREGVQRDLLPIVEGSTVQTKYGTVHTDHILFIASGAFHVSKPSDLIPELQGRFPIRVELNSLTEDDFIKILTIPENALIKQYQALMASEGIELIFQDSAITEIAKIATYVNDEVANIGARRLHTILTTLLDDILFKSPDKIENKSISIDSKVVNDTLQHIVKNTDLSKFIL